jgi:hypothetical protein
MSLTYPLSAALGQEISGGQLILIGGVLFPEKSTFEIITALGVIFSTPSASSPA